MVGGYDAAGCRRLADAASDAGVVMMNVGCEENDLRAAACGGRLFHVQASAAMYAAALREGRGRAPDAVRATLWNPALERFGPRSSTTASARASTSRWTGRRGRGGWR